MFAFKNRFIEQKNQILQNFEANFEKRTEKLPLDEKNKFVALAENIQKEIGKGVFAGGLISGFFCLNMRTIGIFSNQRKMFFCLLPIILMPFYFYAAYMEKLRSFELYLALKTKEDD